MDRKSLLLVASAAILALGGCVQMEPMPRQIVAIADNVAQPVASPVALDAQYTSTGVRFNTLGGEVPRAAPAPNVDEVVLEDIPNG